MGPIVDGNGRGGMGVEGFETLAFGPNTLLLLSLDPSLFLFIGSVAVTGCAHRGSGVAIVVAIADSPLSLPRSVALSPV